MVRAGGRLRATGARRAGGSALAACLALTAACGRSSPAPPVVRPPELVPLPRADAPRSYAVLDTGALHLTIHAATTRRVMPSDRPGDRFGPDDADSLQLATVVVSVPPYSGRGTGELPRPSSIRSAFSYNPDPLREFFVTSVVPVDSARFVQRVAADLAITRSRSLLVFVHGFNTTFEEGAVRAAQIAADLNFDGVVVLFAWPSAGSVTSYVRDQQEARNAGFHLLRLLRGPAAAVLPDRVHLLGHSMGSELIAKAVSLAAPMDSAPRFAEVVLAAPDLDQRVFRREILPRLAQRAARVTLYAANDDDALRASRVMNGVWRLGLGGDSLVVLPGMDTIDGSRVRADVLGHTLFGNQAFLADLAALFAEGKPPAERRLLAVQRGEVTFWRFRGDPR